MYLDNYTMSQKINFLHAAVLGPLVAYFGFKLLKKQGMSNIEKMVMLVVGAAGLLYHGNKSWQKWRAGADWKSDYGFQINLAHFLFIAPLIAWVGYKLYVGRRATQLEKVMLFFIGCSAIIYHGMKSYAHLQN